MASKSVRTVVNAAGWSRALSWSRSLAASTIFTGKAEYGLPSTQYRAMFLPSVTGSLPSVSAHWQNAQLPVNHGEGVDWAAESIREYDHMSWKQYAARRLQAYLELVQHGLGS